MDDIADRVPLLPFQNKNAERNGGQQNDQHRGNNQFILDAHPIVVRVAGLKPALSVLLFQGFNRAVAPLGPWKVEFSLSVVGVNQ